MVERRQHRRYPIWFPVTFVVGGGQSEVWGICRDASAGGMLASTVAAVHVGARVVVRFRVSPEAASNERSMKGVIVRSLANRDDLLLAFPYRLGVEFDAPEDGLIQELGWQADTLRD
jgi:hypothetical protein